MRIFIHAVPALALAAAGCASPGAKPEPEVSPASSTEASDVYAAHRWSGSLQPTRTRPGTVTTGSERNKAFGTVVLSSSADGTRRTRAQLTINMPVRSSVQARWAVLPGRCGTNAMPATSFEAFPLIEISNTGRGQLDTTVPIALPPTGTFHVNVYSGSGHDLDDVVTCANLRVDG